MLYYPVWISFDGWLVRETSRWSFQLDVCVRSSSYPHVKSLHTLQHVQHSFYVYSVFQTSHTDVSINETSSYVDLAPLYGDVQEDQDKIRVRDGRGLLFPDVFAEDRLMLLPPACCVILVLFNRNHNVRLFFDQCPPPSHAPFPLVHR